MRGWALAVGGVGALLAWLWWRGRGGALPPAANDGVHGAPSQGDPAGGGVAQQQKRGETTGKTGGGIGVGFGDRAFIYPWERQRGRIPVGFTGQKKTL